MNSEIVERQLAANEAKNIGKNIGNFYTLFIVNDYSKRVCLNS